MSWNYNTYRDNTIGYQNAMNNLDRQQFALNQYDYGLPGEDDPEVQNIIAQQMARAKLEYIDSLPKVPNRYVAPVPQYRAPVPQYRAPVVQAQPMVQKRTPLAIFQQQNPNKMYFTEYSGLSNEVLDDALKQLDLHDFDLDTSNLGIDYSQFRIPRRRIPRTPKSQHAKKVKKVKKTKKTKKTKKIKKGKKRNNKRK